LLRSVYKKHNSVSGKIFGRLVGAGDFSEKDIESWVKEFYECTGCRRCALYCPMQIDNSVLTRKGRAIINSVGKTPDTMKRVMEVSLKTGNTDNAPPIALIEAVKFMEEEMLEETGVEVKIPVDVVGADYFLVPPSGDVLVNPESMMGIAKVFHVTGANWTLSSRAFDGANYGLFTGDDKIMKEDNKLYVEEAKRLKVKVMMMGECGHAHRIMKFMMEKQAWWGKLPFEIDNILKYTAYNVENGILKFDKSRVPEAVTYHDPCNFGRSCGIVEEPRVIMRAAVSDFREMYPNREENWCCGGGGGLSAMDSIRNFRMNVSGKKKLEQIKETEAKYVAAPCSNCKRQLLQLMEYHKQDVGTGGLHDLVYRSLIIAPKTEKSSSKNPVSYKTVSLS
jgi:Fe-S oxidoreductase